jgi:hypothetical protein
MPVKRREGRRRRRSWGEEHRIALGSGMRYLGAFGSHRDPWPMDEARQAWSELGDEITEQWARERPCLRPWGWWHFVHGVEPPDGKSQQRAYLYEHGLLKPAERAIIEADPSLLVLKPYGYDL